MASTRRPARSAQVTDLAFLRPAEGWLYLVLILDRRSRWFAEWAWPAGRAAYRHHGSRSSATAQTVSNRVACPLCAAHLTSQSSAMTGQSSFMPKRKPGAELNRLVAHLAAASDRDCGGALRQQILDGFCGRRQPRKEQRQYLKSLKEAEGGAYTSAEYERLTDITRQALKRRRDSFAVV